MDTPERNLELVKLRLGYAWDVFAFHARQRTIMFNFFLLIVGIVANGVVLATRYAVPDYFPIVLLAVGAFLSVAFWCLDKRNCQLLEMGEDVLRKLERDAVFWGLGSVDIFPNIPLGFQHREKAEGERMRKLLRQPKNTRSREEVKFLKPRTGCRYKHGFWIPLIQTAMFLIFFTGFLIFASRMVAGSGTSRSYDQAEREKIREVVKQVVAELAAERPTARAPDAKTPGAVGSTDVTRDSPTIPDEQDEPEQGNAPADPRPE